MSSRLLHSVIVLVLLSSPAFAFSCADPIPSQASSAGYNTVTFCWDSTDTISEIDTTGTGVLGKKFYLGTAFVNGHATVFPGDFTVSSGKIIVQTTETCPGPACGAFSLNTCYAPTGSVVWTGGKFFQNGWYVEFAGEWNSTGHGGVQTGFYSTSLNWANPFPGACASVGGCWEVDNPDAYANDQAVVNWDGGTGGVQPNGGGFTRHGDATIQTGSTLFGALATPTAFTWWINNVANGNSAITTGQAAALYGSKQCFGIESTSPFSETLDFVRVIQAGGSPPPVFGGGRSLRR